MRISVPYLVTVFAALLLVVVGHNMATRNMFTVQSAPHEVTRATVQRIVERYEPLGFDDFMIFEGEMFFGEIIIFEARITRGEHRGSIVTATQSLGDFSWVASREVQEGDSVILIYNEFIDEWFLDGHLRTNRLLVLGIIFTLCVLLFGGRRGFSTILSLGLTCGAVFGVFIPAILSGANIYVMSLLVCIYTIAMTLLLVVGFNKKALAAAIGCFSGLAITGILTVIMDRVLFLTGTIDEHSRFLANLPGEFYVDLRAIVFAGIMIGAMGAIMDVALSISSALWEIKQKARTLKFETLYRSGVAIGRDILGSMANTLILAYIGTSLSIVLLLTIYSDSLMGLLNREMIVVEILKSIAGLFGILFAMPLTAFFSAGLYLNDGK